MPKACFEQVVQSKPRRFFGRSIPTAARVSLGNCYLNLDDYESAEREYRLALKASDGAAHYNIGNLRCLQGEHEQALDWLERAFKKRPDLKAEAREDEDFKPLRPYVRFRTLVAEDDSLSLWLWILAIPIIVLAFVSNGIRRLVTTHSGPLQARLDSIRVAVSASSAMAQQASRPRWNPLRKDIDVLRRH